MSERAFYFVARHVHVKMGAKLILMLLAMDADAEDLVVVDLAALADETGYSRRHVQRLLQQLVDIGSLVPVEAQSDGVRCRAYQLDLRPVPAP